MNWKKLKQIFILPLLNEDGFFGSSPSYPEQKDPPDPVGSDDPTNLHGSEYDKRTNTMRVYSGREYLTWKRGNVQKEIDSIQAQRQQRVNPERGVWDRQMSSFAENWQRDEFERNNPPPPQYIGGGETFSDEQKKRIEELSREIERWEGEVTAWDNKKRVADEAEAKRVERQRLEDIWREGKTAEVRELTSKVDSDKRYGDLRDAIYDDLDSKAKIKYDKQKQEERERMEALGLAEGVRPYENTLIAGIDKIQSEEDASNRRYSILEGENARNRERGYLWNMLGALESGKNVDELAQIERERETFNRSLSSGQLALQLASGATGNMNDNYRTNATNAANRYGYELGASGTRTGAFANLVGTAAMVALMAKPSNSVNNPASDPAGLAYLYGWGGDKYSLGGKGGFNTSKYSLLD